MQFNARREHILSEVEKGRQVRRQVKVQVCNTLLQVHSVVEEEEDFGDGYFAPYQRALWHLFERPQSSLPAKVATYTTH